MIYSIKYTDDMPDHFSGQAKAWFIKIRPRCKDDQGLLEHEKVHVRQFWRTLGFNALFCLVSKRYKLAGEVEAYKEQLRWPPATTNVDLFRQYYAEFIADQDRYGLDISVSEAYELLK